MKYTTQSILPYTQEQLFELVAGVERYAEFIPWWTAAQVYREGDIVLVEQAFNLGTLLRYQFASRAALQPPAKVQITSKDGPFSHLEVSWHLEPLEQGGCVVTLATDFQLRSTMLQRLFDSLFPQHTWWQLLRLFETRAHQLYGDEKPF